MARKDARKQREFFLLTRYVTRPLAYPIAVACVRLGITPNQVTLAGGGLWMLSLPLTILAGASGAAKTGSDTAAGSLPQAAISEAAARLRILYIRDSTERTTLCGPEV